MATRKRPIPHVPKAGHTKSKRLYGCGGVKK